MRLSEMKSLLKRYGFSDEDPLEIWINAALHEFEDEFDWPFLEGETSVRILANEGRPEALPRDFRKLTLLRNETNEKKLTYYERHRFEREFERPTQSGIPEIYTLIGLETIKVWPVPTENVDLHLLYVRAVPDLTSEEEVPIIPTQYHYTVCRGAAYIALQNENEEDRAQVAYQAWLADVERAKRFYSSHENDEPSAVEEVQEYNE